MTAPIKTDTCHDITDEGVAYIFKFSTAPECHPELISTSKHREGTMEKQITKAPVCLTHDSHTFVCIAPVT